MSATDATPLLTDRPKRADARRNYDKVIAAARVAFTEGGTDTSLEGIARRAGVGIATLYRNFPTRQALIEAVYVEEVQRLCGDLDDLEALSPWDALATWLRRFVGYIATKRALADALMEYVDSGAPVFQRCRTAMYAAGDPLVDRARAAGEIRPDTDLQEICQLVIGVAKIPGADTAQVSHLLEIVLDGLRVQATRP